jgi:hypothetical protein
LGTPHGCDSLKARRRIARRAAGLNFASTGS